MNATQPGGLPNAISDQIIQLIEDHGLGQGDRLPNEATLSSMLGVGRSSIREAMKLLASRNIVTIKQGSGTYVSQTPGVVDDPLGFSFISDKRCLSIDLLEVRLLLEPAIASMAATRATDEQARGICNLANRAEKLIRAGKPYAACDIEFHRAIAESTGNMVIPRLVPVINSAVSLFIDVTHGSLVEETIQTHRAIARAIAEHDSAAAHDAMYLHLVYNRAEIRRQLAAANEQADAANL